VSKTKEMLRNMAGTMKVVQINSGDLIGRRVLAALM